MTSFFNLHELRYTIAARVFRSYFTIQAHDIFNFEKDHFSEKTISNIEQKLCLKIIRCFQIVTFLQTVTVFEIFIVTIWGTVLSEKQKYLIVSY